MNERTNGRHVSQISSRWGIDNGGMEGQRNNILQKAVLLYVGQLGLKYDSAQVVLSSVKEKGNRDEDSYNMVCMMVQYTHTARRASNQTSATDGGGGGG